MMRHAAVLAAVLAAVVAAVAPGAAIAGPRTGMSLTEVNAGRFPARGFVLTLPERRQLRAEDVRVTENGRPVGDVTVVPAAAARPASLGVVLAIDASTSMRGGAIRDAMAAARAFAGRRRPEQPLGIVTFNTRARVLLPLTTDSAQIDAALRRPVALGGGTRIFDGVDRAVSLLERSGADAGSVVVLSDGTDTGSLRPGAQVAAGARRARARVFAVGLRSKHFDPGTLGQLASAAGGTYSEATSSGELRSIYRQLGAELGTGYVLRYRSTAGPGTTVQVQATVDGAGSAAAGYRTPPLRLQPAPEAFHRSVDWASSPMVAAVVLAVAVLLTAALALILLRGRRRTVRDRVAAFVAAPEAEGQDVPPAAVPSGRLLAGLDAFLARRPWWDDFKRQVDVADIGTPAPRVAAMTATATLVAGSMLLVVTGQPVAGAVALAIPVGVRAYVTTRAVKQRRLFADQLADNLAIVASALRAGHSFVGAFAVVADDAPEPTRREFQRVLHDEQLGVPLETGLGSVVERMDNRDLEQVALVAVLQRETGGNTAEVLDRVADTVRERQTLRRLVLSLTAQGRLSRWVLTGLPIVLLAVLTAINSDYMHPLYYTTLGQVLLVTAALLLLGGSLLIRRIVEIEV